MLVYLKDSEGNPMMPTSPKKARYLLKSGDVHSFRSYPFGIQFKKEFIYDVQPIDLYINLKRDMVEFKAVGNNKLYYSSEILQRTNISKLLEDKTTFRKGRRFRNRRYHQNKTNIPKIANNMSKPDDWLAPSVKSKLDRIVQEINLVKDILPIVNIYVKRSMFDVSKLDIEDVDWDNLRHAIYKRDDYKCKVCGAKGKVEGHHINHIHEDMRPENIITLCPSCHKKVTFNQPSYNKFLDAKLQDKKVKELNLKDIDSITQVRILYSQLSNIFSIKECFGYEFKNLTKRGYCSHLVKKAIQHTKRRLATLMQPMKGGSRKEKKSTGNYRFGLTRGDLVMFEGKKYYIGGFSNTAATLKDDLRKFTNVSSKSLKKLTFLHRFKSLLVQEIPLGL